MKKIFLTLFLTLFLQNFAFCEVFPIDATNNAQNHNNYGIEYLKSKDYYAAIKEFKIALALNPKNQTSAIFNYNMGRAYLNLANLQAQNRIKPKDNFAHYAEISFERAIAKDCMQFNYYLALADSIALQYHLRSALSKYQELSFKNPFASIMVALIYVKMGKKTEAKICLDEFVSKYPHLIIVPALLNYMEKL